MKYYLDTVTLRKLSKNLRDLKDNSFTSALTIFELISGISEREFNIRKQVLKNLFDSNIKIIWDLPEAVKASAFPIIEIVESRVIGLQSICRQLIKSENLKTLISDLDEIYNVDFFKKLDEMYSKSFIEATLRGNENLKKIYEEERKNNGRLSEAIAKDYVKSLESNVSVNNFITIHAIARNLSDATSGGEDKVSILELLYSYNNELNIFVNAFSRFSAQKSGTLGQPAKNDFIDLHHLLYLRNNKQCYMVTDDKMILKITKQSITIAEFKLTHNL